jgi:pimeloyl-ACP methyl ester carboxylesterase/SAM-dependent methyltransferase
MTQALNDDHFSVPSSGGRTLDVLVSGPADGLALVFHSGTPSGLTALRPMTGAASARGLRTVQYARPGYSGSPPHPGRRVADAAADVTAILDWLGIDTFVTAGWSGGGPHALACAAVLPGRCLAAATISGVAPYPSPGLDWLAGMAQENVDEFGAAVAGEREISQFLEVAATELRDITGAAVAAAFGGLVSAVDAAAASGDFADYLAASFRGALRQGIAGWRDDDLAFVRDWGFAVGSADLRVPVAIWQGDQDRMVPYAHGEWLAAHVTGARPRMMPGHGHLTLVTTAWGPVLDDLIELAGPAAAGVASLRKPAAAPRPRAPAALSPGFSRRAIRDVYDAMAAGYAQIYGADLNRLPLDTEILDLLARRAAGRGPVLDVGCGPAHLGAYLAARGARVVGLDLAPLMLAAARRRGAPDLGVAVADLRELPVASGSCAALVSFYVLHHLPRSELGGVLGEFRRALAPGGELALAVHEGEGEFVGRSDPLIMGTLYSAAELEGALARAQLRVETVRRRDPLPHERQSGRVYVTAVARN